MREKQVISGIIVDEDRSISFVEVCEKCDISEQLLESLLEQGLLDQMPSDIKQAKFSSINVQRIQSARRLQQDFGLNDPGVVFVIELLDELEHLKEQLSIFNRHINV